MFHDIDKASQELLASLLDLPGGILAVDTEATGLKTTTVDEAIGVSIATVIDGTAYSHYFPFRHKIGDNCSTATQQMLTELLVRDNQTLIFCNAQYDIITLLTLGIDVRDKNFIDIPTMAHLIDENKPYSKSLDALAQHYLKDDGKIKDPELDKEKKLGWPNTSWDQISAYAQKDAELTWRLYDLLQNMREWTELPEGFWTHKQDFIRLLISMKQLGVRVDQDIAQEYVHKGEQEMARIVEELGLNPGSPKQLKHLLIDKMGLPVVKKSTKTGAPSFDKQAMTLYDDMLERIESPVARLIKEYRGWQKAVSASYKPYLTLVDTDGRLRCSYKTHGTATGRLSCSEPNLQQIPKSSDKEWNGKVKECFIPQEGYVLLNADFSQLELRLATAYANEEQLKKVFNEGRDIFTEMSKQLGMSRHDTKTLVYSMQYGAGEQRIMNAFGVTRVEARKIRENYFATYPKFRKFNELCTRRVEQTGEIMIWSGRKRHFDDRTEAYKAMNSVIQGGAADIVERIMVRAWKELDPEECRILLTVHDSVTFEVQESKVPHYMNKVRTLMENVNAITENVQFDVRFDVEVDLWVPEEDG